MLAPQPQPLSQQLATERQVAGLVEQQQHGHADPVEKLQLGHHVARLFRLLRGVDQVEDEVGLFADVERRLLARPQRSVGEPIPGLLQEPDERLVVDAAAASAARRVAEARRVPQLEDRAVLRYQLETLGLFGHVGLVEHLADVAAQQRARQGRLADVGVGDEA